MRDVGRLIVSIFLFVITILKANGLISSGRRIIFQGGFAPLAPSCLRACRVTTLCHPLPTPIAQRSCCYCGSFRLLPWWNLVCGYMCFIRSQFSRIF